MKHTLKQRVLITMAATVTTALIGTLTGDLIGRAVTLKAAKAKLMRDATFVVAQGDAFSDESRAVLATLNASAYPFCSETEIAYFRKLLFQSKYLRDAGRMRNGVIACSATMTTADLPAQRLKPDITQPDGTLVFANLPLFKVGNSGGMLLQFGSSYVVYAPHLMENQGATSSHVLFTPTGSLRMRNGQTGKDLSPEMAKVFTTNGQALMEDSLYVTRCSAHYFRCATTYISTAEAMAGDHVHRTLGAALGGLIGALAGLFSSLLYRRNRSMEHQLRRAIARDKVRLVYQPIVDLATRDVIGAEALARWTDEEGFAVGPDVFVRVAEEYGFVGDLTRLVVRHALRDFAEIIRENPDFRLSINVAASDLSDPKFLPMLGDALAQAEVPAKNLAIEITESSTARHQVAREAIRRLRQSGHSVHVDDFGTGYSSLSYLQDLSVDTIKIDRSFIQAIGTQAVTVGILPQILAMASVLHLDVIVEGVETSQQASYFAGVDSSIRAQGWLFGRPVPLSEFRSVLAADQKKTAVFEDMPEQGSSPIPLQVA
ncbi:MAG: EAL domain-containing protein [Terracidiphilus sp.]|jgi:sensor c-di-GMP phosphodiesterase-like protein